VHSAFFVGFESAMIMGDCQPFPNPSHFQVQDHTQTKFSLDNDKTRSTDCIIIEPPYNSHILPSQQGETDVCIYKPPSNGRKTEDGLPCDFQPLLQAPPL